MIAAWLESGRLIEWILVLIAAEMVAVGVLARVGRRRLPVLGLLFNLGAGAALLLALRSVLLDSAWAVTGGWLALALIAHIADLVLRVRRSSGERP